MTILKGRVSPHKCALHVFTGAWRALYVSWRVLCVCFACCCVCFACLGVCFVSAWRVLCVRSRILPSKERKTLGRGGVRLEMQGRRESQRRRQAALGSTKGGLAGPSGRPMPVQRGWGWHHCCLYL